ncbi:MAG TPA: two-component system regulatory protein YycI, partial [Pseudogracilibacillus sp.]|nr:two-component system regulatory protein YycI [Pseudogracilibacillus sp.]
MQWDQIKNLLIVSFLILDVYLFVQFLDKKEQADIGILEQHTSSIEEQLKDDRITYEPLPVEEYEETFISVKQYEFTEADLKAEAKEKKQTANIIDNNLIVSKVDEKISISESATEKHIMNTFADLVYFAEEYTFWNWNKDKNVLIFFQNKFDRPVYYNQGGMVLIFLNENNEVDYYLQSMLGDAESLAEKRELMSSMQAIETLYRADELPYESHIDNVNIG